MFTIYSLYTAFSRVKPLHQQSKLPATWLLSISLYMFTICSLYVYYIFTIYSLYVHYILTIYSLYTAFSRVKLLHQPSKLPATRLLSTSLYMFTVCSLYIHYMFTIYSLYVHNIFTIYSIQPGKAATSAE